MRSPGESEGVFEELRFLVLKGLEYIDAQTLRRRNDKSLENLELIPMRFKGICPVSNSKAAIEPFLHISLANGHSTLWFSWNVRYREFSVSH
jgi:hypothetical protein